MNHRPDPDLRGRCEELSRAAVETDPTLRLARGWYDDPVWGSQEHWWTVRPDGTIHDPTARQFPVPGITVLYREYDGIICCMECGKEVPEDEAYLADGSNGVCSGRCYGRMVGLPC